MKIKKITIRNGKLRNDSLPDVDLDFEDRYRDKVKGYLEQKYGSENVSLRR